MESIGTLLRKCRMEKELTIQDVENAIKIRGKYIQAIEEENFDIVPGEVYLKGFIRNYANYIGLDGNLLVQHYNDRKQKKVQDQAEEDEKSKDNVQIEKTKQTKTETSSGPSSDPSGRRWAIWVGAIILIAALFVVIPHILNSLQATEEDLAHPPGQNVPSSENDGEIQPIDPPSEAPTPPPQEGYRLVEENGRVRKYVIFGENTDIAINAQERPCWYQASENGRTISTGIIQPGQSVNITSEQEVRVQLGDPGAVEILLNNDNLGVIGQDGIPITLIFSLEN